MKINLKEIHIGKLIKYRIEELEIENSRCHKYLNIREEELQLIYEATTIDCELLLKFCKLLEYDFFRLYTQHLILYSPLPNRDTHSSKKSISFKSNFPEFKKNIYTIELIHFILERIRSKEMTITQIIEEYRIPKTTLYKWIKKYDV